MRHWFIPFRTTGERFAKLKAIAKILKEHGRTRSQEDIIELAIDQLYDHVMWAADTEGAISPYITKGKSR